METAPRPHVMVATPCYGGLVHQRYMQCIFALLRHGPSLGFDVSLELLGYDSLIPRARNTLVATFLDMETATHLMFIDADIGFETASVQRMLEFDKDVVAGLYPLKLIDWSPSALQRATTHGEDICTAPLRYVGVMSDEATRRTDDGFVTGTYAGTGFLLIKRDALKKMIAAFPETRYSAAHSQAKVSPNQYALFDTMIDPITREYLSEDYAFCQRWRALGGDIWLDGHSRLMHIGPHEFLGDGPARFGAAMPRLADQVPPPPAKTAA